MTDTQETILLPKGQEIITMDPGISTVSKADGSACSSFLSCRISGAALRWCAR